MSTFAQILGWLATIATFWGYIPSDHWFIRAADFPRIQILTTAIIAWGLLCYDYPHWQPLQWTSMLLLSAAILLQLRMILPYTPLWRKEVQKAKPRANAEQLRILVSNVLTPNNNTAALINLVKQHQPDLLLTLETDQKWQDALSDIENDYPYSVKIPLDNLYGMHLYARRELINPEIHYHIVDDIPSISTQIEMQDGTRIWLYCLHPMPPSPTEADKSTTRDAELLLVGQHIQKNQQNAILMGDLNDVAWSKTTRIFRRVSGLLDPRIGRQFTNTFHAKIPLMRWALDHLFHSPCFTLVKMQRLPNIGSDHFPVLTTLQYEGENTSTTQQQNAQTPNASEADKIHTREKIQEGKAEGEKLNASH